MKNLLFFLSTLCVCFFEVVAQDSSGSLGDVKYSILDPDHFLEINGRGWVLMMGQSIQGSDLNLLSGISILPDSRGNFIRSMNLGRAEHGDPNITRQVGSFQSDTLKRHSHFKYWLAVKGEVSGNSVKGFYSQNHQAVGNELINESDRKNYHFDTGGVETRPKNIALYTYIKINRN